MAEMTQTQIDNFQSACKEYGITWDGNYKTSDCGNIQIDVNVATKNLAGVPKTRAYTITYDANNPDCFDNVFSYMKGAGGDPVYAPEEYAGGINDYYLNDTTHNHVAFFCNGSDGPLPDGATAALVGALSGNDNKRVYVDAGSSAGTQSLPSMALNQLDNAKDIYYMSFDAKGQDTPPGEPMAKYIAEYIANHPELDGKVSALYAFESNGGLTGPPENAVQQLSRIAYEDGIPTYLMVDETKTEHAGVNSPDFYISDGSIDAFFDTINGNLDGYVSDDDKDGLVGVATADGGVKVDDLSFYEIEGREDWKNISLTTAGTAMITLSAAEFLAGLNNGSSDIDFVIDFNSVRENLNILRNGIGATNLEGRKPYECVSNSSFPNSLNDGTSFLYGTSKDLMNKMSLDIRSVEKIASLLQETDENTLVNMLNETFGTENLLGANAEINGLAFDANANNHLPDIFSQIIKEGAVGRISMEDIDGILRGNTLIGSIGKGLEQEIEEANAIKDDINNLLATTNMSGPIWDKLQIRFNDYNNCCDARINASECLQEAYVNALNILRDYYYETADKLAGSNIYLGGALDDGQIPVCQATIEQLRADIKSLNAEFDMCMAVPPIRGTGRIHVDANGREWEEMEPNEPEYTNAQLRAKEITYVIIPQKNEEIRYNNIYIDQLEGLAQKVNMANEVVTTAIDNIQASYTSMVSSIQPIMIADSLPTVSA